MKIQNLLVVRNDRMGDLLMSLPAVHALRASGPQCRLTLLVQKGLEPLVEGHPDLDRILVWDPAEPGGWNGIFRWAGRLRRERFDAVLVLNPSRLFHAASFLAGIPVRVGYRRKLGVLLTRSITDTKTAREMHESEYNLELARLLGVPVGSGSVLSLPSFPDADQKGLEILNACGISPGDRPIAIHPWTSNPVKGWPLDSFVELIRRFSASGRAVLVIGGPEYVQEMLPWKTSLPSGTADLVGRVPLRLLPALLRRCAVLVSNDSGPVHVAAAVGTPVVVVAPETHARLLARWRPLGNGHRLLFSPGVEEVLAAASSAAAKGER